MIRPIDSEKLKRNISKLLKELGPTITDTEFENLILKSIDNEPMCNLDDMQNIIDYYKKN